MSIAETYGDVTSRSQSEPVATLIEWHPAGARLKDGELRIFTFVKSYALFAMSALLVVMTLMQWIGAELAYSPELALMKLVTSVLMVSVAVILTNWARRSRLSMFEVDTEAREIRTVLEADPRTVINRTAFDDISQVHVFRRDGLYVLAVVVLGAKRAEVLAVGSATEVQRLQHVIERAVV